MIAALAAAVLAQSTPTANTDDWILTQDGSTRMALAAFSNAPSVAVRCSAGEFQVLVGGLPPAPTNDPSSMRPVELALDDDALQEAQWFRGSNDTVALARLPATLSRRLRTARRLTIRTRPVEGGARRYTLDLPAASQAVDSVMAACDIPLIEPRDAMLYDTSLPGLGVTWRDLPRPDFPSVAAARNVKTGTVVLSCRVSQVNRPTDCRAEMASPRRVGFEEAAIRAAEHARLGDVEPTDRGRVFVFTIRFRLQ